MSTYLILKLQTSQKCQKSITIQKIEVVFSLYFQRLNFRKNLVLFCLSVAGDKLSTVVLIVIYNICFIFLMSTDEFHSFNQD